MSFAALLFYLFAALLIGSAIGVVVVRNSVYAALLLIVAFFNSAGLWMLLKAEFLSITLVLVYVGAVMVLFLFIIMMLNLKPERIRDGFNKYFPIGAGALLVLIVELIVMLQSSLFDKAPPEEIANSVDNTSALGKLLYTEYLYPLEIAAVVLLVAIIAAIMLTLRRRADVKVQDVDAQVQVQRSDRVRLVNLPSGRQS